MLRLLLLAVVGAALALGSAPAPAADPIARAVLFYSPACPHCHTVMTDSLPPLMARYRDQLQIAAIDVTTPAGQQLYQAMVQHFQVPDDRLGVPALVIGKAVLVGAVEIPERLPALIDAALVGDGLPWPDIPGLAEHLRFESPATAAPAPRVATPAAPRSDTPPLLRDMPANALALAVLAGMLAAVVWAARTWRRPRAGAAPRWRDRAVPLLSLAGLAVAVYLTLVETAQAAAVCGPVGNCAAVQQSSYAFVFGIPVGVLGVAAYIALLLAWGAEHLLRGRRAELAGLAVAGLAGTGTVFSIYLTFLEPFVIGATCLWCLTSAALMTALLYLAAPYHGLLAAPRREVARGRQPRRKPV